VDPSPHTRRLASHVLVPDAPCRGAPPGAGSITPARVAGAGSADAAAHCTLGSGQSLGRARNRTLSTCGSNVTVRNVAPTRWVTTAAGLGHLRVLSPPARHPLPSSPAPAPAPGLRRGLNPDSTPPAACRLSPSGWPSPPGPELPFPLDGYARRRPLRAQIRHTPKEDADVVISNCLALTPRQKMGGRRVRGCSPRSRTSRQWHDHVAGRGLAAL
jgi:hypothetical protein